MSQTSSLVRVRFIKNHQREGVIGKSAQFQKIAFISSDFERQHRNLPETLPRSGEEWMCLIVHDTKQDDPRKGALLLHPQDPIGGQWSWEVRDPAKSGQQYPQVIARQTLSGRCVTTRTWHPGLSTEPRSRTEWPQWIKDEVFRLLVDFDLREAKRAEELRLEEVRQQAERARRAELRKARKEAEREKQEEEERLRKVRQEAEREKQAGLERLEKALRKAEKAERAELDKTERPKRQQQMRQQARAQQMLLHEEEQASRRTEEKKNARLATILKISRPILIVDIRVTEHLATLQGKIANNRETLFLFLDGEHFGRYNTCGVMEPSDFPLTIQQKHFTLSNGETVSIYSRSLSVLSKGARDDGYSAPSTDLICHTSLELKHGDRGRGNRHLFTWAEAADLELKHGDRRWGNRHQLTWTEAAEMQVGQAFAQDLDHPFQWVEEHLAVKAIKYRQIHAYELVHCDYLTNGVVSLPRIRPERGAWHKYPFPAVNKDCWEMFLAGLEGKYLVDWIAYHREVTTRSKSTRVHNLTPRQLEVEGVIKGSMWKGCEGCDHVSAGRNVLFTVHRTGKPTIYVVDNPGVGAIYLFDDYLRARDLADGTVSRTTGIQRGYHRIYHRDGWQERLSEILDN